MTLKELIEESVKENSEKIFVVDKNLYSKKEHTYKQIYEKSLKIVSYFERKSIKKGDKILIYIPNSSDYVSLIWACALSGVIAVPIDINSTNNFAERIYKKVKAKLLFCSIYKTPKVKNKFFIEEIDEIYEKQQVSKNLPEIKNQDIFEIVYTSGTTSEPKGVVLTQENLYENILSMVQSITFKTNNLSMLSILPLSHLFEQNVGLFSPIKLGAKIIYIQSKKSSEILETIKQEKINSIVTVPLFLDNLKNKIDIEKPNLIEKITIRKKLSTLKRFIVGGSALTLEIEKFWTSIGLEILQGYGMTEASPVISCNSTRFYKQGSVGKPLPGIEIKIENEEILAKGKNIFSEYYENKQETDKIKIDGWLYTGDLGKIDEEGYLFITGRKKNVIISSSGLNIYPEDIEKQLNKLPEIKDSVVLGLENGSKIVGIVLTKQKINEDYIKNKVNFNLSDSQKLSKIIIWKKDDFPRTSTKKIIRKKVEEELQDKKEKIEITEDELKNIIAQICEIKPEKIKENSIISQIGLDSIKRIELVTKIEERFNIEFEESNINEKTTLKDLREKIKNNQNFKSRSQINFLNSKVFNPLRFILQGISFSALRLFYKIELKGKENLSKEQCIFIANHTSMLDTFVIYKILPLNYRLNTCPAAAKDFFFKNFILGALGKLTFNAFGFSRKEEIKQSLKDFGKLIDRKMNVLIYPEGTRSRTGELLEFKEGIGILAREMQIPLVPIKIEGLHEILPVGKFWPKRGKVKITIGKRVKFNRMHSPQEITKNLHEIIRKL